MASRTTTTIVTFVYPFFLAGYSDELPAGDYGVIVNEDVLENLSFLAYRKTAVHIWIFGQKGAGKMEMRPIDPKDIETALSIDQERILKN